MKVLPTAKYFTSFPRAGTGEMTIGGLWIQQTHCGMDLRQDSMYVLVPLHSSLLLHHGPQVPGHRCQCGTYIQQPSNDLGSLLRRCATQLYFQEGTCQGTPGWLSQKNVPFLILCL